MTDKKQTKEYNPQSVEFTVNKQQGVQVIEKSMTDGLYCNYCGRYVDQCQTQNCPYYRKG